MKKRTHSRNMCWNSGCKEQRMIPKAMEIWICPKCGNHNPNMALYERKRE